MDKSSGSRSLCNLVLIYVIIIIIINIIIIIIETSFKSKMSPESKIMWSMKFYVESILHKISKVTGRPHDSE